MKIEFDSISELEQFLIFSAHIGKAFAVAPPAGDSPPEALRTAEMNEAFVAAVETREAAETETTPTDKPKRTRRTKAEIEAERAAAGETVAAIAEVAQPDTSATTSAVAAESVSTQAAGNPFAAAPSMQAILDAPNQGAATLAAMAALQSPAAELKPIESIDHLRACQAFIQKHGMTKYNESFGGALTPNIAAYTPEQRAEHVAKLDALGA